MARTFKVWVLIFLVYQCPVAAPAIKSSSLEESTAAITGNSYEYYSYENYSSYENSSYEYYSYDNNASYELGLDNSSMRLPLSTLYDVTDIKVTSLPAAEHHFKNSTSELDGQHEHSAEQTETSLVSSTTTLSLPEVLNMSSVLRKEDQLTTETAVLQLAEPMPSKIKVNSTTNKPQAPSSTQTDDPRVFIATSFFDNASYLERNQLQFSTQTDVPKAFGVNTVHSEQLNKNHTKQSEMHRSELTATCDDGTQCTVLIPVASDDSNQWMKAGIGAGSALSIVAAIAAYAIHRKKNRRQVTPQTSRNSSPTDVEQQVDS